jgi:hypothetical protein
MKILNREVTIDIPKHISCKSHKISDPPDLSMGARFRMEETISVSANSIKIYVDVTDLTETPALTPEKHAYLYVDICLPIYFYLQKEGFLFSGVSTVLYLQRNGKTINDWSNPTEGMKT